MALRDDPSRAVGGERGRRVRVTSPISDVLWGRAPPAIDAANRTGRYGSRGSLQLEAELERNTMTWCGRELSRLHQASFRKLPNFACMRLKLARRYSNQIGRASCRERG